MGGENGDHRLAGFEDAWLIPAWAGKTRDDMRDRRTSGAHPRVGGENLDKGASGLMASGSSPRGRGKPKCRNKPHCFERLIPAWAGKTRASRSFARPRGAHPRVGGENGSNETIALPLSGSSPRGRGKQRSALVQVAVVRLIPAWAGKTPPTFWKPSSAAAHPRVGGENHRRSAPNGIKNGSSPRGRGKHFLTCAFIKRIGQILETLELAVSSGSYSLCDVYATDAPQDQARNTGLALPSSRAAS